MTQKAFWVGTHRYSPRAGEPAEIIGVAFITPEELATRACYHLRFKDGEEGYIPLSEAHHFEIISEDDVTAGRIPEVVH